MPFLCQIALLTPPYATLTYGVPEYLPSGWVPGLRVAVPLGRGAARVGVIVEAGEGEAPAGITVRPAIWPLERAPLLSGEYMAMVKDLAVRQSVTPGYLLSSVLPAGLRSTAVRLRFFTAGRPRVLKPRDLAKMPGKARADLAALWLEGKAEALGRAEDAAEAEFCRVAQDPPWPLRPGSKRQLRVLEYIWEKSEVSRRNLLKDLGPEAADPLKSLVDRGLVRIARQEEPSDLEDAERIPEDEAGPEADPCFDPEAGEFAEAVRELPALFGPPEPPYELSAPQKAALEDFRAALSGGEPGMRLLYGITGSGKTAVYLELARACLEGGRSVLLLAPEVALAAKLKRDATNRLPNADLFFFHGYQRPGQRERAFRELAERDPARPCLIVGTRSALFLPTSNLGLVVLDEEHDASFKQDEGVTYHAKELAWFRALRSKALLVLGSATPDIKTFHAARDYEIRGESRATGESGPSLRVTRLPDRVGGGTLPAVELVDIRTHGAADGILAPVSLAALRDTVARGEQAVVLLNRRGYSLNMYCLECGTVARCPHCEIALTHHKARERLLCHYCGYSAPFPTICANCRSSHFLPMGEGTEKLEESLSVALPPGSRVLRLDRDSTRRPGRLEEILESFALQRAQVLVGTQMLSKGHHFPNVTLSVVADADLGLSLPDYRAAERTFQLLVQSAGRAGRGEKSGRVLIQTRNVDHYCWRFVRNADYDGFFEHELAIRKRRRYPPFTRLALVRIHMTADWGGVAGQLSTLAEAAKRTGRAVNVQVLGPAPAPIPMLRGRRRFQCLLKSDGWSAIRGVYAAMVQAADARHVSVRLDMDPVSML